MKMPYITSIERRSEQRGELKGKQELITRLLNRRFGEIIVAIALMWGLSGGRRKEI